jgi:SAM-dependent methyltransferase
MLALFRKSRINDKVPHKVLSSVDAAFSAGTEQGYANLRSLNTETVGRLLLGVPAKYRHAAAGLPRMAEDQVQKNWTGTCGAGLLTQSVTFIEAVVSRYQKHVPVSVADARVLDYGCGWGRLIRLMYAHAKPENIFGCDPWDQSIQLCEQANLRANLAVTDYVPSSLPFATSSFHLVYAFSVFTHLSQRTADAVMSTLRKHIAPDGMLVITIRPETYWPHDPHVAQRAAELQQKHRDDGFAFVPHIREAIDGDVTYGDTSMSIEYVEQRWPDWKVLESEIHSHDPYQRIVYLKPV